MSSDTKHAEKTANETEGKWLAAEKKAQELEKKVRAEASFVRVFSRNSLSRRDSFCIHPLDSMPSKICVAYHARQQR